MINYVQALTFIKEIQLVNKNEILVFPNPNSTNWLYFDSPLKNDMLLINSTGIVLREIIAGTTSIEVSKLPKGIYLMTDKALTESVRWIQY